VLLYGQPITERLREIQRDYLSHSRRLELADWNRRPIVNEYVDRAVGLLSPLL